MATKAYKKGDKVTVIGSWDEKGTAYYRHAVVYSCGVKQMVLTDEQTGEEIGRHYKPIRGSLEAVTMRNWDGVFPRMTDIEAEELSMKVGARVVELAHAHYRNVITTRAETPLQVASLQARIDELHEPRAMKR